MQPAAQMKAASTAKVRSISPDTRVIGLPYEDPP